MQFPSRLLAGKTCIHMVPFMFSNYYARADLFLYFQIKGSNFFVESFSFGFCLVNFERGAYLAVDGLSLVYNHLSRFISRFLCCS